MPMQAQHNIIMANQSVHPSVTLWYCVERNAHIIRLVPPVRGNLFFGITIFQEEPLSGGIKYMGVEKYLLFLTEIAVYL